MSHEEFVQIREDMREMRMEIVTKLERMNEAVQRHETDIALLKSISHPQNSCPLVFDIERDVRDLKVQAVTNARVAKLALAVGGIIAAVAQVIAQTLF